MTTTNLRAAAGGSPVERDRSAVLRETIGGAVGSVFYGTLMKTMRNSKLQGAFGHGGRGEELFAAQLHTILAERMGARSPVGLVDSLYRRLERQQRLIDGSPAAPTRAVS